MSKKTRREIIENHINIKDARILEIGALDNPTYEKSKFNIKYLDFTDTTTLARKGTNNPRYTIEKLVDVDYICPDPEYSHIITEKFDLVIANHVIEHIPDTIRWLENIYIILDTHGILFLSVPDKRYTFDIVRRETTFIDLLKNYNENIKKPDFYHILEHFYYHKSITTQDAWTNSYGDKIKKLRFDAQTAVELAEKHVKEPYADVHCHVWTSNSFKESFNILVELKKTLFKLELITQPLKMNNEFYVILRK